LDLAVLDWNLEQISHSAAISFQGAGHENVFHIWLAVQRIQQCVTIIR